MSQVKSKNTKPEIEVRKLLFSKGLRYRINYPIIGRPDIVLIREKIAIFVNGCFWHGHKCKKANLPKTNTIFWKKKIKENIKRDKKVKKELQRKGWIVITIWECESKKCLDRKIIKIINLVKHP